MGMPGARIPGSSRAGFAGTIEGKPASIGDLGIREDEQSRSHELEVRPLFLVEDCCAAGTDALHLHELAVLNRIYCHVVTSQELRDLMGLS